MNRIPLPIYNDAVAISNLALNTNVASFPNLQPLVTTLQAAYVQYEAAGGSAFRVVNLPLPGNIENFLRAHYKSPPKDLAYIKKMREDTEHHTCPMCGSFHRGTLDHLLPKQGFAAFAIFTKNLVPACKCNTKRQETLTGLKANERILHPYFDDCLSERLICATFDALGPVPRVGIKLQVPVTHPDYAAIDFHFRSIVKKTAINGYLRDRWIDMCRKPSLVVRELRHDPATLDDLRAILVRERDLLDDSHRSKNNWNSVYVSGLLDEAVLRWMFNAMHSVGRAADGSLI